LVWRRRGGDGSLLSAYFNFFFTAHVAVATTTTRERRYSRE